MDSGRDGTTPRRRRRRGRPVSDSVPGFLRRRDPVVFAVLAIALVALGLRVFWLGYRTAHWDEARVGYWILRYEETGAFAYRSIIHGPFVHHVTRPLFSLFGPSDFVARLPVAIVGGLFPLSTLLYREHLRDHETVFFALLLSLNPILLYYSRFLRSDVLVAAFMMTALGFLVRTYDTRRGRYLYPAAVFLGFGIASKENALIYIVTWLGAAALLVDVGLFRPRTDPSGRALVRKHVERVRRKADSGVDLPSIPLERHHRRRIGAAVPNPVLGIFVAVAWGVRRLVAVSVSLLRGFPIHVVGAGFVLFLVWLFMFAPRGAAVEHYPVSAANIGTVTLRDALWNPLKIPELVGNTWGYWYEEYPMWTEKALTGGEDTGQWEALGKRYDEYKDPYFALLKVYALPSVLFGAVGFVHERYAVANSRHLVLFCTYAGVASVIGYPLGLDIFGPWNATHPVVVLALPAAVGLGLVYRWGRRATEDRDPVTVSLAALLLMLVFGHVVVTSGAAVYVHDTDHEENDLIQYAQPAGDLRYDLQQIDRIAAENEGTDVLLYGSYFVNGDENSNYQPACMGISGWFDGLPLPWYLKAADANVSCKQSVSDLQNVTEPPPVVITREHSIPSVTRHLEGFERAAYTVYELRIYGTETAIFFADGAIDSPD